MKRILVVLLGLLTAWLGVVAPSTAAATPVNSPNLQIYGGDDVRHFFYPRTIRPEPGGGTEYHGRWFVVFRSYG